MIVGLYAVQDFVAGVFHPPFVAHTAGTAERFIRDMVSQPDHPYGKHPADYFLWRVGAYDDAQALVQPEETGPVRLLCLSQLVAGA